MSMCSACGSPLIRESGLLKCPVCGLLYRIGQTKPLLQNYAKIKQINVPIAETEEQLMPDQLVFINRLAQALAPTTGLMNESYKRALKVQQQYREELRQVFLGKKDFNKWFDQTRSDRGIHIYNFSKIIYECLEGLTSPEAQSMREQYAAAIARLGTT